MILCTSELSIDPVHFYDNYVLLASVYEITSYTKKKQKGGLTMCFGFTMNDDELLQGYYIYLLQAPFWLVAFKEEW